MEEMDLSELNLPEKEKKILQAAIQVFSQKGFSASTTSEIAKNAGIAEGTIFRYYKTKKDILRSILIQLINLISGKLVMEGIEKIFNDAQDKDLRSLFKELLYDRLRLAEMVTPMLRVVITEAIYHEDVREAIYKNIITRAIGSFTVFHQKMIEQGLIRSDVSSTAVLRSIIGSMATLLGQKILFGDKMDEKSFETEVENAIDILICGLMPKNTVNNT